MTSSSTSLPFLTDFPPPQSVPLNFIEAPLCLSIASREKPVKPNAGNFTGVEMERSYWINEYFLIFRL
jgi:hypothetical protein